MIALEHTLIMLLLLVGLLNAKPNIPRFARWVVIAGVFLAFVAPVVRLTLPWNWLSALVIPLLIWQIAHRLVGAQWLASYRDAAIWFFLVVGITLVIAQTAGLALSIACLFGLLIVSMVWQAAEETRSASLLGMLGPLTLAFLITEIDPAISNPGRYMLSLFGGLGLGALVGYLAVQVALRIPVGFRRDLFTVGQVYLAYIVGIVLGVSSITAAVFSVIVYVAYGVRRGVWPEGRIGPRPLNSPFVFLPAAAALAFFAWQTHVPLAPFLVLEIGLTLLVVMLAILIGRWMKSRTFTGERLFLHILPRVTLLLVPAALLWQPAVPLNPGPLAVALLGAGLTTLSVHLGVSPLLNLYRWLDEFELDAEEAGERTDTVQVRALMRSEWLAVSPDLPVRQLARLFQERSTIYALVTDGSGCLIGIVTEADLFIKEEHLPRTERTYPALFKSPILLETLVELYPQLAERHTVADIMTSKIITVRANHSIGKAAREMIRYGIESLPVLSQDAEEEGKPVGLITRSDIIYGVLEENQTGYTHRYPNSLKQ